MNRDGCVITLEETQYAYDGEFEDVPPQYRRGLQQYPEDSAPKVLVVRGNPLTLTVPASPIASTGYIAAVLEELVQLQSASHHDAHFRAEQVGYAFDIVPTENKRPTWKLVGPDLHLRFSDISTKGSAVS
jgi:hypothetical protein